jgi:hypothetical protein
LGNQPVIQLLREQLGYPAVIATTMRRTAVINQIRSLPLERGITFRKGRCYVGTALPRILEMPTRSSSGTLRMLLAQLKPELDHLDLRIDEADALIKK